MDVWRWMGSPPGLGRGRARGKCAGKCGCGRYDLCTCFCCHVTLYRAVYGSSTPSCARSRWVLVSTLKSPLTSPCQSPLVVVPSTARDTPYALTHRVTGLLTLRCCTRNRIPPTPQPRLALTVQWCGTPPTAASHTDSMESHVEHSRGAGGGLHTSSTRTWRHGGQRTRW